MEDIEINDMDKRNDIFHHLEQIIDNFNTLLENVERPGSEHKIIRVLNQLKTWMDEIIRGCLAMLTMDRVVIMRQQLDEFKSALTVADKKMEVATRYGIQAKEIFPVGSDKIIEQKNVKQIEITKVNGALQEIMAVLYAALVGRKNSR